jgi:hypothetical protein
VFVIADQFAFYRRDQARPLPTILIDVRWFFFKTNQQPIYPCNFERIEIWQDAWHSPIFVDTYSNFKKASKSEKHQYSPSVPVVYLGK